MQPIVHLSVGYLCYAAYTRWRRHERPRGVPVLVVLVGAGLPDLLDKPLAAAGIVDVGRTVGHSLFTAAIVMTIVWLIATRCDRRPLAMAFVIGYTSHIAADVPWHVLSGDIDELGFLLWPVTEMPAYTGVKPLGTVGGVEVTTLWLEAVIFVAGIGLWWRDGKPGLETLKNAVVD